MKFPSIQALRALAATLVVIFHGQALCHKYASGPSHLDVWLGGAGQYGVDLFFVLSGFVIQYTLNRASLSPGEFLERRLTRIVPIYWIVTAGMIALSLLVPAAFSGGAGISPQQALRSFTFTGFALNTTQSPIIYVGWTLEYEMLFYLLVWLALCLKLPVYRSLGALFLALYAGLHLLLPQSATPGNPWNFLASPLLFEFLFGVFIARRFAGTARGARDWAVPLVAIALVAVLEPHSRVLFAGVPAALILWLTLRFAPRALAFLAPLGDASYSTYLLQVIALPAIGKIWQHLFSGAPPDLLVVVATVLVLVSGYLLYAGVERPVLRALKRGRASVVRGGAEVHAQ